MQRECSSYLPSNEKVWNKMMNDMVNHPAHYTSDPSGVECIDIVRHRNYNIGNAIKYLWRAGLKNEDKHIEDLKKAIFYINDEIKRLEGTYHGSSQEAQGHQS